MLPKMLVVGLFDIEHIMKPEKMQSVIEVFFFASKSQ